MDPRIDDYIRDNDAKYTREAIREQLIAAGHDPTAIDAALQRAQVATVSVSTAGDPNAPPSSGGDRAVTLLVALNSPSGGGNVTYASPGDATFTLHPAADGISGMVAFDGLMRQTAEGPESSGASPGPISGTISWTC